MSQQPLDTIWFTRCPVPTPLGLAAKLGWFDSEFAPDGISIKSLREVGNTDEKESHYDHHLINSFRQGGNVPAIWARSLGRDTRVIGLNWINEFQAIIALPESCVVRPGEGVEGTVSVRKSRRNPRDIDIKVEYKSETETAPVANSSAVYRIR